MPQWTELGLWDRVGYSDTLPPIRLFKEEIMGNHRVLSTVIIKVQPVSCSKKGDSAGPTNERFSREGRAGWEGPRAQCTPLPGQQPRKAPGTLYFKKISDEDGGSADV